MIRLSNRVRGTVLWTGAVSLVAYLATGGIVDTVHLHLNCTDSIPIGLYRETTTSVGPYVAFCLPTKILKGLSKKDIAFVPGTCPGGMAPVLKPVVQATPLHPVLFTEHGFSVHETALRNTAPRSHTRSGATLTHYPFGCYTEGLWVISDFNPNSYDSRYFGPIPRAAIRFYATPFLTQ